MNWKRPRRPGLDGGKIDLALALRAVPVARREQSARHMHGHIEDRAGAEVLVVDVAGVDSRRPAADAAHHGGRREAHGAEERMIERHHHAGRDFGGLGLPVDRNDALPETREFVGQGAGVGALAVVAIAGGEIDGEDADLEHVSGHRAVDEDRSGENVRAGAAVFHLAIDVAHILRHGARRHRARRIDRFGFQLRGGFQRDDVARIDGQSGFVGGVEVSDVDGFGRRHQREFRRAALLADMIKDASSTAMRSFGLRNPVMETSQRFGFVCARAPYLSRVAGRSLAGSGPLPARSKTSPALSPASGCGALRGMPAENTVTCCTSAGRGPR